MTTLAVVQARAGSTRLPGKVLMSVAGRPMLAFMLERLAGTHVDRLVVATSTDRRDDAVAEVAAAAGVAVVRGSESDVLARFAMALDTHPADVVVRLTADCPLIDPALVDEVVAARAAAGADYASNTIVRTYPDGLDVEVLTAGALSTAAAEATDPAEREHVTPFVYRRPERFRLVSVVGPEALGHERWTVDTADDLERVRAIVAQLDDPIGAGWRDILSVAGRHPLSADHQVREVRTGQPTTQGSSNA
jgi:spore coat polysaccharide biosynthesis protein SpsF